MNKIAILTVAAAFSSIATTVCAAPVYLNQGNISVAVGAGTTATSSNNTFDGGQTINKVIDAPSATASETHNQTTHIWYTGPVGSGLELLFDFGVEYNISTLHFWNYNGESFDVDQVDFTFFNALGVNVGSLTVNPALGSTPNIFAQDIVLAAPLNVKNVTAFLSGSNGEVDFQNIGFTAEVSNPVSEPAALGLLGLGLVGLGIAARRRQTR